MADNRAQFSITYNPYVNENNFIYQRFDSETGEWAGLENGSPLVELKYVNNTLQAIMYDLARIVPEYAKGRQGVDVFFSGTDTDYNELRTAFERVKPGEYYQFQHEKSLIEVEDAIAQINEMYDGINQTLSRYQDPEIQSEIDKYQNAMKEKINICVIGNYSSGKSSFINALIGRELLPSASDAKTAKIVRISASDRYEIDFTEGETDYILNFYKDDVLITPAYDSLHEEIKKGGYPGASAGMYRALERINELENIKDAMVEVWIPFGKTELPINEYQISIYDTPGKNSDSNKKHEEILSAALEKQGFGLPIIVTTPTSMDNGKDLINELENKGSALDSTNTLIVVNQSDNASNGDLEKKKKNPNTNWLSMLHSSRVYYVSSIVGLGAKNGEKWLGESYDELYSGAKSKFFPEHKFYKQLYRYNLMPEDKFTEYCGLVDKPGDSSDLLYYNSGIHCVEWEIANFARRHSAYNRCARAREYLGNAVNKTSKKIKRLTEKLDEDGKDLEKQSSGEENKLNNRIQTDSKRLVDEYVSEYVKIQCGIVAKYTEAEDCSDEAESIWRGVKSDIKAKYRIEVMNTRITAAYNSRIKNYVSSAEQSTVQFWKEKEKKYKEQIMKIVNDSNVLTTEQKEALKEEMDCNVPGYQFAKIDVTTIGAVKHKHFLFIKTGETLDIKKCRTEYHDMVRTAISSTNRSLLSGNQKKFENWGRMIINIIKAHIAEWNPILKQLSYDIKLNTEEKNKQETIRDELQQYAYNLESILGFKEDELYE